MVSLCSSVQGSSFSRPFVCCMSVSVSLNRTSFRLSPERTKWATAHSPSKLLCPSEFCLYCSQTHEVFRAKCFLSRCSFGAVLVCLQFCWDTFQMGTIPCSVALLLYHFQTPHAHRRCAMVEMRTTSSDSEATSLNCCLAFVARQHRCHLGSIFLGCAFVQCTSQYTLMCFSLQNKLNVSEKCSPLFSLPEYLPASSRPKKI